MQHAEQQLTELRTEFARRRRRQFLAPIPIILGIGLVRAFNDKEQGLVFGLPTSVVLGVALALGIGVMVFSFWNWRCPACKKYLGMRINPAFCSKCGVALR